jgi:RNA polymerase sigma-70 factor, ECF subfamily
LPTDDELATALIAARDGDERGFAVLWRALNPAVLRYLRVVAGDAADDAASETWLQVARDLDHFTGGPGEFRGWLFRIARHRGIDEHRRGRRRREDPAATVEADSPAPDAAAEALEGAETAWALSRVAALPADQAEAVMLRIVAGLDVPTTARVLGKRAGAVRIATMRGLRRLAADPEVRDRATGTPRGAAAGPEGRDRATGTPRGAAAGPEVRDHTTGTPRGAAAAPEGRDHSAGTPRGAAAGPEARDRAAGDPHGAADRGDVRGNVTRPARRGPVEGV